MKKRPSTVHRRIMFAVFGTAGGGNRDVGRDLVRSRLVQQHHCAPRRQTPSLPLHSPHRHSRSYLSVFCSLPATVKSNSSFKSPDGRKEKPRRNVSEQITRRRGKPLWVCVRVCVCVFVCAKAPACSHRAALEKSTNWMEEMSKRHRLRLSSARGQSSRRGSAGEGVPVHSAIMMLTGRGGWGY